MKDVFLTGSILPDDAREYRFCEPGTGNIGVSNDKVIEMLLQVGWDGWIHIEHDSHLREPLKDLTVSLKFIRNIVGK